MYIILLLDKIAIGHNDTLPFGINNSQPRFEHRSRGAGKTADWLK